MIENLIQLAKECPNMTVSISVADLVEANNILIGNTIAAFDQRLADEREETYLSRDKVMEMLGVCYATLWRWQKIGYLVPLNVGGKRRYRKSDVKRILEGGDASKTKKGVRYE